MREKYDFTNSVKNPYAKKVVESELDFYFDYTDSLVEDKITQDIRSGKMKIYDSKDVYKELGMQEVYYRK